MIKINLLYLKYPFVLKIYINFDKNINIILKYWVDAKNFFLRFWNILCEFLYIKEYYIYIYIYLFNIYIY